MAYTEEQETSITIRHDGSIQTLVVTKVLKDGVEIARNNHRAAYAEGVPVASIQAALPVAARQRLGRVAEAVWSSAPLTPENPIERIG